MIAALALASCSHGGYDAAKSETLISAFGAARQMQDLTKDQWRGLYSQYVSLDASLRQRIMDLLATPWSADKEKAINELLASQEVSHWRSMSLLLSPLSNSGFAASAYFSEKEVADMRSASDATMLELQNLLAQADLDGK